MSDEVIFAPDRSWGLITGECREIMNALPADSVDAIVTDPPYELGFMGKDWDGAGVAYDPETWRAAIHVLKPGGHMLAFGATRNYHRMAVAIEDAGFEIRDSLMWLYGSGFPKSLDVSKAIDKAAGAEREAIGRKAPRGGYATFPHDDDEWTHDKDRALVITAPATDAARQWKGWGTALKPAYEPIVLARKPLSGTVAQTVTEHGTGALNIDASRIDGVKPHREVVNRQENAWTGDGPWKSSGVGSGESAEGRWPANVILDPEAAALLDAQTDQGGASRFFYNAKTSKKEREAGLEDFEPVRRTDGREKDIENPRLRTTSRKNHHPTVKPIDLMRWLVRLITPPDGLVLDPFVGSGSTGIAARQEGFRFRGIDQDPEYIEIAAARMSHWEDK